MIDILSLMGTRLDEKLVDQICLYNQIERALTKQLHDMQKVQPKFLTINITCETLLYLELGGITVFLVR